MTRRPPVRARRAPRGAAGFTIIEMLVTLVIFCIVVLAILGMIDINSRVARVEMRVSDLQQSLRMGQQEIVRLVRMAARGGLPPALFPDTGYAGRQLPAGLAIEVADNAAAGTRIAGSTDAAVLQGTDVITVRGVFTTLYQSNSLGSGFSLTDSNNDGVPEKGMLILSGTSPTGVSQDLKPLADAIDATRAGQPEAFLLVSPLDENIFAVVEIDATSSYTKSGSTLVQATVRFNASGTARSDLYIKLSPGGIFPKALTTVAYSGLLEEYRYYIRDAGSLQGRIQAGQGNLIDPCLVRARLYPGTSIPYGNQTSNLREEIADGVFDLQAALGVDTNGDLSVSEGYDTASRKTDEWLFNEAGDDPAAATWNGTSAAPRQLAYLRITTLGRTSGADPHTRWQAPLLARIEDKDYQLSPWSELNSTTQRRYRRQSQQSLVDLRNLS